MKEKQYILDIIKQSSGINSWTQASRILNSIINNKLSRPEYKLAAEELLKWMN